MQRIRTGRSVIRRCVSRAAGLLSVLVAGLFGLACSDDGEQPEVWRFAIEETVGSVQDRYAQEFKRRIEERSLGQVEVKVYPYGTLGTSDDVTEQLRMGSLQFAMASPGHLGTTIPELQVFLLHFVFSDDDRRNMAALADPEFRAELEPLFRERELELLSILHEGWMVWTTQEPVSRPQDFEGVRIRTMTSPLLLAAYEAYGASPQAMPYGEVYSALQLNMIDAQVNPIFAIEEMSFYEVTNCMIFPRAAPFLTSVVTHPGFLAGLEPERRAWIEEVVRELEPYAFDLQQRLNAERLELIEERKPSMTFLQLDESQREAFRQRGAPVRELFIEEVGPSGRQLLSALLAAVERAD